MISYMSSEKSRIGQVKGYELFKADAKPLINRSKDLEIHRQELAWSRRHFVSGL